MEEDIFNTELGRKILALTKAGFKVSDLISDLVMREKIKLQILEIYKNFLEKKYSNLLKEIDTLDGFLFLAGQMNLIKEDHVRILRNGFLVFKSRVILATTEPPKAKKEEVVKSEPELNERQRKIMKYFQENNEAKLAEILGLFPGVSEKTVRNELSSLIGLKKITRSGQGGSSFYKVVRK